MTDGATGFIGSALVEYLAAKARVAEAEKQSFNPMPNAVLSSARLRSLG